MNRNELKNIVIPRPAQLALYALLAMLVFGFIHFEAIADKIKDSTHFNQPAVKNAFEARLSELDKIQSLNTVTIIVFWGMIGLLTYTVVWLGIMIFTQARNEVVVETDFVNRGSFKERVKIPLIQLGVFLILLILTFVTLKITLPTWLQLFGNFLLAIPGNWVSGLINLSLAFLGMVANLYIIHTFIKIMLKVDHLIED